VDHLRRRSRAGLDPVGTRGRCVYDWPGKCRVKELVHDLAGAFDFCVGGRGHIRAGVQGEARSGRSAASRAGGGGGLMRLGLNLGYRGAGVAGNGSVAQEAERAGFHSLWTAEAWGSDAVTPLTWLAAKTERINVGTAIMQMPARTPANAAMTAATLDLLTGGRFLMGLRALGPHVVGRR